MAIVFICLRELVLDLIFNDTEMTSCRFQVIKDYILISATDTGYRGEMYYIHLLSLGNKKIKKISTLKTVEETRINEECAQKTDTSELGNNSGRRQERKGVKAGRGGEAEV